MVSTGSKKTLPVPRCLQIKSFGIFPNDLTHVFKTIKVTLESHLIKDLGLDSLDHVEIIVQLEDTFGLT